MYKTIYHILVITPFIISRGTPCTIQIWFFQYHTTNPPPPQTSISTLVIASEMSSDLRFHMFLCWHKLYLLYLGKTSTILTRTETREFWLSISDAPLPHLIAQISQAHHTDMCHIYMYPLGHRISGSKRKTLELQEIIVPIRDPSYRLSNAPTLDRPISQRIMAKQNSVEKALLGRPLSLQHMTEKIQVQSLTKTSFEIPFEVWHLANHPV